MGRVPQVLAALYFDVVRGRQGDKTAETAQVTGWISWTDLAADDGSGRRRCPA
jgi:hypothetical protein